MRDLSEQSSNLKFYKTHLGNKYHIFDPKYGRAFCGLKLVVGREPKGYQPGRLYHLCYKCSCAVGKIIANDKR